ncbi:coproporphyrinogen dehydrogenase HemZ [Anoxynatronum buryatiense]|uniref:Oxygen-independent coproporphyrinogen-3 oxidase n=1 Tax=Anoxynatronum buryatiense TaxID=489973 RepID=A0AA45WUW6_9CLOT|nr:coproporphyrinogen dehydrogenase HemZ [Anoxynatronum buryatiense]SMP49355.1 oxygen-independent coproporphyrinogen-3 oxidase [Anoxynatronum buryatiense]
MNQHLPITLQIIVQDDFLIYETRELARLFYPAELTVISVDPTIDETTPVPTLGLLCYSERAGCRLICCLKTESHTFIESCFIDVERFKNDSVELDRKLFKRDFKQCLFKVLQQWRPRELPWGILTGVRPVKLAHQLTQQLENDQLIRDSLEACYFVSKKKAALLTDVAAVQRPLLDGTTPDRVSMYIGVPLCPSRCTYCSFISQPVKGQNDPLLDQYLEALIIELKQSIQWLKEQKRQLDTIYIGGGTPSVFSTKQIHRLMDTLARLYPLHQVREITFEAGRPDTLTLEKLRELHQYPVHRLSINPQTFNDSTLTNVNRQHTVHEFYQAWEMALAEGFSLINLDIIIGLPGEGIQHVRHTLKQVAALQPPNLTVHALALKRSSSLAMIRNNQRLDDRTADLLMDEIEAMAYSNRMRPYYLYRQKEITGHLENIGYSLPGTECLYNVLMMEEKQTILGIGAGAVSKQYFPAQDRIRRIPNPKSIHVYIQRMLEVGFNDKSWELFDK